MFDPAHHMFDAHFLAEDVESGDSTVGIVAGEPAAMVGQDALRLAEALDDALNQGDRNIGCGGFGQLQAEDRT